MLRFSYKAKDLKGKYITGLVEARDLKEAAALLRDRNLFVIAINQEKGDPLHFFNFISNRVSFSDTVNITNQLSTMITAGLTLSESLAILRAQIKKPALLRVIIQIHDDVQGGKSFAASTDKFPSVFSPVYRSLIRAGEASGKLDTVLERLAENLEKSRDFRGKLKSAFVYPIIVVVGMLVVLFLMMTFVIPKLTGMYKDFGVDLPLPTKILTGLSSFFVNFWLFMIIGAVILVIALVRWKKTKSGARIWDKFLLSLPILGNIYQESTMVELTRTLSILVGAGIPILSALEIVEGAVNNTIYKDSLKDIENSVERGFPLGTPFSENPIYPPILGQMVSVGEQTGKLDESLLKLSRYFEKQSDLAIKVLTTAIEPLIMVVLGVGVGFIVLAVLMPIYSLTSMF